MIATVFDKLNHEYKKYLEAEQSYTMVNYVSYSSLQIQDIAVCFSGGIKVKASPFYLGNLGLSQKVLTTSGSQVKVHCGKYIKTPT